MGRAGAADALSHAPSFDTSARARRIGTLLEAMNSERYPAVRHIAWRSLRRLVAPGAGPARRDGRRLRSAADVPARAQIVSRGRRELGAAGEVARVPDRPARDADLEIGE